MKVIVRPRIVLVPYPAQGHVTPMLHLAAALYHHGFRPVVAVPDFIHRRITARANYTCDDRVAFESVPSGLGESDRDFGESDRDFFAIDKAMESRMPAHFERMLKGLMGLEGGGVVCVVVDLLASWAIRVADGCGIRTAGFWPAMLATYRVVSAIPELIRRGFISDSGTPLYEHPRGHGYQYNPQLTEEEEAAAAASSNLLLPTKPKLRTKDLPWLVGNSSSQKSRFKFWLRTIDRSNTLPYLLVNSFPEEDGQPDEQPDIGPHIFRIGPLLASNKTNHHQTLIIPTMWEEDKSCINWLDQHPPLSVIYISFGSWVPPIGHDKISELALALEATNRPFLWVLRDDTAWRNGLPPGFLDQIAVRGKVVGWAPQEAILAHRAVGCYVTHCGWNSTVEAIRYGKRMVCYPISGDQFLNCDFIVRVWGIGIKLGGVGRREVEDSIGKVMEGKEGEEIQERVLGLKEKVMGYKGGCRARDNLKLFVNTIMNNAQ